MARCGPLGMTRLSALTHLTGNALSQYLYPDIPFLNVGKLSSEPSRTLGDGDEAEHKHERAQTSAPHLVAHSLFTIVRKILSHDAAGPSTVPIFRFLCTRLPTRVVLTPRELAIEHAR